MPEVLDPFNRRESLQEMTELQKKHINREEGGKPVSGRHTAEHVAKLPVSVSVPDKELPAGGVNSILPPTTEEHDPELNQRLNDYALAEQRKYGTRQLEIAKEFVKQAEAESDTSEHTDAA